MRAAVWIVVLVTGAWQLAQAGPQNGFGLGGGLALHRVSYLYEDAPPYTSGGLSVGGDGQFVVDDRWSLNPYLLLSLEGTRHPIAGTVSNGAAGFELRRWSGDLFLGLRLGYYVELLSTAYATSTSYGPGFGVAFGGESAAGSSWGAQLDAMRGGVRSATHVGLRLHIGHRWGDR